MLSSKSGKPKEETITARCDSRVKSILYLLSRSEHLSMSETIEKLILDYHQRYFPNLEFFEMEKDLFGRYKSGLGDLSLKRKGYLKERLSEKHSHH